METILETVNVDIGEPSELLFKVKIDGADSSPVKVRLVCEAGDVSYMFNGVRTEQDDIIKFTVPTMAEKLTEGTHKCKIEVFIDNRYFTPVQFDMNFKKAVSVVMEAVAVQPRQKQTEISVSPVKTISSNKVTEKAKPTTLKERYQNKKIELDVDDSDILAIRELARTLLRTKRA
jgi:hypothetical protein